LKYKVPHFVRNDVNKGDKREIQDFSLRSKSKPLLWMGLVV
jgi:hypothetical protein